jgi:hypothetical protein
MLASDGIKFGTKMPEIADQNLPEVLNQEYPRYRNRLLEVEHDTFSNSNDVGNRKFVIIVGIGAVAAVLLAVMLSLVR